MSAGEPATTEIECLLLWKLARSHGWGAEIAVSTLVSDAPVGDEQQARAVAWGRLADRPFVAFHPGRDTIWLRGPPGEAVISHLRDECGYSKLQVEATFSSYLDRL